VPIDARPSDFGFDALPYGGDGGGRCTPGIASVAITVIEDRVVHTHRVLDAPLTVDVAMSPDGSAVALAMPGAPEGTSTLGFTSLDHESCEYPVKQPRRDCAGCRSRAPSGCGPRAMRWKAFSTRSRRVSSFSRVCFQ